jgi:hypothetical protein
MSSYYYRGKRYASKPSVKVKLKATLREYASRAWESIQGGHPGGAEALVERMIREYPGRPAKAESQEPATPPSSEKD